MWLFVARHIHIIDTMKLNSKYFDSIRVKPDEDRALRQQNPECQWVGCDGAGTHRAPKGRGHDGEYHLFCINHVREYNKTYNYFNGMSDDDVIQYQKSAMTGHRPTWSLGNNPWAHGAGGASEDTTAQPRAGFKDSFGMFGEMGADSDQPQRRPVRNAERKALSTLAVDETATPEEIKARYKMLVKRHHPDANGGGREAEDKLREIIQAYDYLKSTGFC